MSKNEWEFFNEDGKCGIKTKWATICFNAPVVTEHYSIPAEFVWHTWDRNGFGGENSYAADCQTAIKEATEAAERQGFISVDRTISGIDRIATERKRQIEVEGWTEEHDMQHSADELARAAAAYATNMQKIWPWSSYWWKPSADPIRNLEKAGALIAAAIDRIQAEEK